MQPHRKNVAGFCLAQVLAGAVLLPPATVLSQETVLGQEVVHDIGVLIERLGHPDFQVRQEASQILKQLEDSAVPQIAKAAQSTDIEIRRRAVGILRERALAANTASRQQAVKALTDLSQTPDSLVRSLALATLDQVTAAILGRAHAELTAVGALVMPVYGAQPRTFNVQIGQAWQGEANDLKWLSDLGNIPWLSLENSSLDDRALGAIGQFAQQRGGPTQLFLGSTKITGARFAELAALSRLEYLSLKQLPVTDAQLASLPLFAALHSLGLDGTRISNEGLRILQRYPRLQVLWLDNTQITDAGLIHLGSLSSLRTLYLPGTQVQGSGLAELRKLPGLTALSLKDNTLSADCLRQLGHLDRLESLGLDQTNVADAQLAELGRLKRLRVLWLTGTQITDQGLANLKALRGLQILHLGDSQVTKEGAAELQQSLAHCQITMNGRPIRGLPAGGEAAPAGPPHRHLPAPKREPGSE